MTADVEQDGREALARDARAGAPADSVAVSFAAARK